MNVYIKFIQYACRLPALHFFIVLYHVQDVGVMATNWDMHDTYKTVAELEAKGQSSMGVLKTIKIIKTRLKLQKQIT